MSTATELLENVAEISLSYSQKVKASLRPQIVTSKDAADIFQKIFSEDMIALREEFWVMYLNRANKVLGLLQVSTGGTTGTVVDAKFVLSGIVKLNACGAILCHNHPSGNTKPSQQDIDLTKKISAACKLLDGSLLDHVIISPEGNYYSFADEGMM
jgi:DNA repair protein RadC